MKRFATSLAVATLALSVGCSDDDMSGASGLCGQIDALLASCGLAYTLNYDCPEPVTEYDVCVSKCFAQLSCDELISGSYCGDTGAFLPSTDACYDACNALSFLCSDSSTIPASLVCNYEDDCPDGGDEVDCPVYTCDDGEILRIDQECDGFIDCAGAEDETGCLDRAIFTCWGQQRSSPPETIRVPISTPPQVEEWLPIEIAAGGYHSCAVDEEFAMVVCWGNDDRGQADPPVHVSDPDREPIPGTATHVATGEDHSCAIQATTDDVYCWGNSDDGQAQPGPVYTPFGKASAIAAGGHHSCMIELGTGVVVCWGEDDDGESTPPGGLGVVSDLAAGDDHNCAIQAATGNVVCWGADDEGQSTAPDSVNGVSGTATAVSAGRYHSCAVQTGTGDAICWGRDDEGQSTPPDEVNGVSGTASAIAAGGFHSCAIQVGTGNVVCWGYDDQRQSTPPDEVNGVAGTATTLSAGGYHNCTIQAGTGAPICWHDDGVKIHVRWACDNVEHCPDNSDESSTCWYHDYCSP